MDEFLGSLQRYPILQDLDFVFEEGEREKMYSKLATKLNKTRSELEALLQTCSCISDYPENGKLVGRPL